MLGDAPGYSGRRTEARSRGPRVDRRTSASPHAPSPGPPHLLSRLDAPLRAAAKGFSSWRRPRLRPLGYWKVALKLETIVTATSAAAPTTIGHIEEDVIPDGPSRRRSSTTPAQASALRMSIAAGRRKVSPGQASA